MFSLGRYERGGKERTCPLLPQAAEALRALLERTKSRPAGDGELFRTRYGQPLTRLGVHWRPLLFADHELAEQRRTRDPVAAAEPSASAKLKKAPRQAADGTPLHSFPTLLQPLASVTRNVCRAAGQPGSCTSEFELDTRLSEEQERAMELLKGI